MNKAVKIVLITGAGLAVSAAGTIFVMNLIKEVKRQNQNLKDELEQTNNILDETIEVANQEKLESYELLVAEQKKTKDLEHQVRQANFEDIDYTGKFQPNGEFEEMRKRMAKDSEDAKKDRLQIVLPKTKEVKHNIFEEKDTVVFDTPEDGSKQQIDEKVVEEKRKLRYDKDSKEAFNSFVNMSVADLNGEEPEYILNTSIMYDLGMPKEVAYDENGTVVEYLRGLFNYELPETINEYDENIINQMLTKRRQFFGNDSVYSNSISFAELILYWVERLDLDMGNSSVAWTWYLMDNIGVYEAGGPDALYEQFEHAMTHNLWKTLPNQTVLFGIFGLIPEEESYGVTGEQGRFNTQYQAIIERFGDLEEGTDENENANEW